MITRSQTVEEALARGATVITGNARAARRLHLDYGRRQQATGREAWATPAIADWKTWLRSLWDEWSFRQEESPLLLTPLQEAVLWRKVQGADAAQVVSPDSLASLAQDAYSLLCAYEAHASRNTLWQETDAEHFRQWAAKFDRECSRRGWLSASRMEEQLTQAAERGELQLPQEILLTGFDRLTPAQKSLLNALQQHGTRVTHGPEDTEPAKLAIGCAPSERAEIEGCALWLRERLEANPEARLAVLCTDVEQQRGVIDRVFREALTPESQSILNSQPSGSVFEFTLGHPLSQQPVVRAALLVLSWLAEPISQADATWLLLSGFICGSESERMADAQADAVIRAQPSLTSLIDLHSFASSAIRFRLPDAVRQRLQLGLQFAATHRFASEARMPSAWSELARLALETVGWPGFSSADSAQYQAQQRWEKALDEVARLDLHEDRLSYARFLQRLALQAHDTLFAPESLDAPVQVMGPMEAAGQDFDGIWFLGATDAKWPSTGRAHPLLPLDIQRNARMPHAERDDDWQMAQMVTERVLGCTGEAICSYARHNSDGELRPSSLMVQRGIREFAIEAVAFSDSPNVLETIEDAAGVSFQGGAVRGGAALLRDQAACPFRAFATHRLHAKELDEPGWGLNAMQRGVLLHEVLCRFWQRDEPRRIEDLQGLKRAIAEGALADILHTHIESAFASLVTLAGEDRWMLAYLDAEKQRLAVRLEDWLGYEAERRPFVVEACERKLSNVQVGSLELGLQADRVDRLEDGSRLLIDYKSGNVNTSAWQGERPEEPQLPLYAVYGNVADVSGVLFAKIRADGSGFLGHLRDARSQLFAELKDSDKLVKAPYEDAMHDGWQMAIAALADEFARGEAAVEPLHGRNTCQHCPLPSVCRIHELTALDDARLQDHPNEGEDEDE